MGLFQSSTSPFNLASPLPMRPCNLTPHLSIRLHHRPTLLKSPDLQMLLQVQSCNLHLRPIITSPTAAEQHGSMAAQHPQQHLQPAKPRAVGLLEKNKTKRKLTSNPQTGTCTWHLHLRLEQTGCQQHQPYFRP